MTDFTRRALIRDGSVAAGAAALLPLALSDDATAESETGSVFHVFAFQWKPGTSEAQKDKAARDIRAFQE